VSVYLAYSDESGTPNTDGQFVVGGYVTPESEWPAFSAKWTENVLNARPAIPYLHMVEIRSKEFQAKHGLTWDDNVRKVRVACREILNHKNLSAYFGSIPRKKLSDVYVQIEKSGYRYSDNLKEPDYMCFLSYAWSLIVDISERRPDVSRVNFVVSKKQRISHYYQLFRDEMRSFLLPLAPNLAALVGDLVPRSMEDQMALQAADVFCWHLQRHYAKSLTDEDSLNLALLCESSGTGHEWTSQELETFASGIVSHKQ